MRLLYVIESLAENGGAEQSLVGMVPHWVRAGTQVHIAVLKERQRPGPSLAETARGAGATLHQVSGGRLRRTLELKDLVRSLRPDVVHTTLFEADVAGRVASRLARVPVVTSLVNTPYGPEQRDDPKLRGVKLLGAHAADLGTAHLAHAFHALTEHVAKTMSRRLLVPSGRMVVIPRGRDAARLGTREAERRAAARRGLALDASQGVLLSAARQEHQKGLDVLIEGLALLPAARRPIALLAGREGAATDRLHDLVEQHGLTQTVRFLGSRSDVAELMCAADVFALPSRWEGLGSVLLEAMCLELPIVASDVPAVRETLGREGQHCLVRPDDPQELAAGIAHALERPSTEREGVVALRERFLREFTVASVAARMNEFQRAAAATGRN